MSASPSEVVAPIIVLSRSNPFLHVASSAPEAITHVNRYLRKAAGGGAGPRLPAVGSPELEDFEFFDVLGRRLATVVRDGRIRSLDPDPRAEIRGRITALLAGSRELAEQHSADIPDTVAPVPPTPGADLDFEDFVAAVGNGDEEGDPGGDADLGAAAAPPAARCRFIDWLFGLCG